MSFGGSVAAMISSLKNNARDRKTLYDNKNASPAKGGRELKRLLQKQASPENLAKIRLDLAKRKRRDIALTIILMTTFLALLGWFFQGFLF